MLKARDVMTRDAVYISPDAGLAEAIRMLLENKISGMPVCTDDKKVVGMISEVDILNFVFSGNVKNTKVKEAMSTKIISFAPDTDIDKISLVMAENKIRRVPIIEDGKMVGIISRRSIIKTVIPTLGI